MVDCRLLGGALEVGVYGSDSSVPLPGLGTTSTSADHSAVTPVV